jgi:hypothetical protein
MSPYLVSRIIEYIETKDNNTDAPLMQTGFIYVGLLIISQCAFYLITEHLEYYQKMIGVISANSLVALIFRKQLKLSSATNKQFNMGEVVNFVQVDA